MSLRGALAKATPAYRQAWRQSRVCRVARGIASLRCYSARNDYGDATHFVIHTYNNVISALPFRSSQSEEGSQQTKNPEIATTSTGSLPIPYLRR